MINAFEGDPKDSRRTSLLRRYGLLAASSGATAGGADSEGENAEKESTATAENGVFDRLARMAVRTTDTAAGLVVFFGDEYQHNVAVQGPERERVPSEVRLSEAACAALYGIVASSDTQTVSPDPSGEPDVHIAGGVEQEPFRFRASTPIFTPDDVCLGAVCVLDTEDRDPQTVDRDGLRDLAAMAQRELAHRHRRREHRLLSESVRQLREAVLVTEGRPLDPPGPRIVYANPAFEEMTGYTADEIVGETPRILQGPETSRDTLDDLREALEAGDPVTQETINYRKDGTPYIVQWSISPMYHHDDLDERAPALAGDTAQPESDDHGLSDVEYWISVQRDVTERRQDERKLVHAQREAETRGEILETIFDKAPLLFCVFGPDGDLKVVNDEWERVSGWGLDEIDDVSALMEHVLPDPERREEAWTFIKEAPNEWRTFQAHTRDGSEIDTRWTFVRLSDDRRIGIGIDVTERQKYERRLREERDRLVTLLDSLPTPVVHGVPEGDRFLVRTVNAAFEDVFGVDGEDIRGHDLHDVIVPEGKREEAVEINHRVIEEPSLQAEVRRKAASGIRDFRVQAAVRDSGDGPSEVYAIYSDVTEQKKQEQRLRSAKQQAEEAAQLKSAMLANMSHEVRTPLTSITGFSEMLADQLDDDRARFAEMIYDNSQRLMQTLDSVLQLSKLDAGAYELTRTRVDVCRHVVDTADMLRPKAEEAAVHLAVDAPDHPVYCQADDSAVDRIITNLVDNAIKFTSDGGRVDVRVRDEDDAVVLEVEDTGVGISEDFLPQLFDAFKQESEGLHRSYEGTGLGLAITKRLVEAISGTIAVDSEKGRGTRVTVCLPKE